MRNQISEEQRMAAAGSIVRNDGRELVIPKVLALHEQLVGQAFE